MSASNDWGQANDEYLAAALDWLRLRLLRLAGGERAPQAVEPEKESAARRRLFGRGETGAPERLALPSPADVPTDERIEAAARKMAEAAEMDPPPALKILGQLLGLSPFEEEILLLCAAMDLDTRTASLCARAQDDPGRPYPTFALALALFDDPTWEALSPERPLRYWRLLEINQPGAEPLTTSALRADERVNNYLKGLNYLDDRLAPLLSPVEWRMLEPPNQPENGSEPAGQDSLPPSQQEAVEQALHILTRPAGLRRPPLIQLTGPDPQSKELVAAEIARSLRLRLYRLPAGLLPTAAAELETLARLWQRESILLPIALYLDAQDLDGGEGETPSSPPIGRFLSRLDGLALLAAREARSGLPLETFPLDVARPTPAEQQSAWRTALGEAAGDMPERLAAQFNLNLTTIRAITRLALAEAAEGEDLHDRLWQAALVRTRPRLDVLAQRIDAKATWDDIVLPANEERLLRQIAGQVGQRSRVYETWGFSQKMNRGLGINALFAGESGTGKTMAAEVIANDLQLNLYRIDLSAVVSKYIGETEKNLRRLFDAAEDGGMILFFDEADALFGKRSEVKDSHDRYANIEVNYLLQRMETYRGLAILATNMKSALDQAFLRRLRFIVNFPFPGAEDRRRIWQNVFPAETPTEGLDFERLARFNLTGGSIHNIALNAAFLAAQAGTPVTMPLVLAAARDELRKLERPANEADFRWP